MTSSTLVTIDRPLVGLVRAVADCQGMDVQSSLAQDLLYSLGIDMAEGLPPRKKGQSLLSYIESLGEHDRAMIEALGIGQGRQVEEALKAGARLILYDQFVTNRWVEYAAELDVRDWSPYVTHILDDCLRMSDAEGRRWAVGIAVIALLYAPDSRERFGLLFQGDEAVDSETGELITIEDGLLPTPQDVLMNQFSRYAREAGVKLRDLLAEVNQLPYVMWGQLSGWQKEGYLEDAKKAKDLGWDKKRYEEHRALYQTISEIRRILDLAADPILSDKQVNRQATGGKSTMPPWVLPEDVPPAWASYLEGQFPGVVSSTGSTAMGMRLVQVRRLDWPRCPSCEGATSVGPRGPFCTECGHDVTNSNHVSTWSKRVANENGRYPQRWDETEQPSWKLGAAEEVDVHGLKVAVWELAVELDELG